MRSIYTFEVECVRAGQPRPYADSEYEYKVTGNRIVRHGVPALDDKAKVFPVSAGLMRAFVERELIDPEHVQAHAFDKKVTYFHCENGLAVIKWILPYCD